MASVFFHPSRFAVVAALPFLLAAKPLAAPMAGGTTYEFVVRSQSTQTGDKEAVTMRGRGTFAGTDGRIDILETSVQAGGSQMFGAKGSYFLLLGGGKHMVLVDPVNKQYMDWDMASMLGGMSKAMGAMGGMMKMEMSDIKIEAHDLGAGERLQGYATHHYQMVQNYTVAMKMFGRSSKNRTESTIDYYFAPALKGLSNPFVGNSQAMSQSFDMFNNPDYKSQMAAAQAKIEFGVPLKSVIRTVATDDKGKQNVSVVTSEMLNFKNTDVPSSTFAIPANFTKIEMPKLDAGMAAGAGAGEGASGGKDAKGADINADSIAAAAKDSAGNAAREAAKNAGKEAAKNKIKGIFKR